MDDSDPHDWSVHQVVDVLCHQEPPQWHQEPHIKPIPGLQLLEDALLKHDIDGEYLLNLSDTDLKKGLGLHSFGQRRAIEKVITYLRSRSRKFEPIEPRTAIKRSSEELTEPENAFHSSTDSRKRRRIAPTFVADLPAPHSSNHDLKPSNEDEYLPPDLRELRERYKEQSEESVYGGSVSSGSDTSSIFEEYKDLCQEVEDEEEERCRNKEANSVRHVMTNNEVEETIQEVCHNISSKWLANVPQRIVKRAYREWNAACMYGDKENMLQAHQDSLGRLETRMTRLKNKIQEEQYFDEQEVRARCGNLEATIEDMNEQQHYIEVLNNELPPTQPIRQMQPRPKPVSGEDEFGSYDIAESESDVGDDDWLDDFMDTDESPPETTSSYEVLSHGSHSRSHDSDTVFNGETPPQPKTHSMPTSEELMLSQRRNPLPMPPSLTSNQDGDVSAYKSDLDQTPRQPLSQYRHQGHTLETAIEISSPDFTNGGSDRNSSASIFQSPLTVRRPTLRFRFPFPPVEATRDRAWETIATDDHRLALAKEIYTMDPEREVSPLVAFTEDLKQSEVLHALKEVLEDHNKIWFRYVADRFHKEAWTFAYLFVCYIACKSWDFDFDAIPQSFINTAMQELDDAAKPFHTYLNDLCRWYIDPTEFTRSSHHSPVYTPSKKKASVSHTEERFSSEENSVADYSDIEQHPSQHSARKYRKRLVKESQEARNSQKDGLARVELQEKRRAELVKSMQMMEPIGDGIAIPVNTSEPIVYLDQHIAQHAKKHQVSGIQFMWRELIEDQKHQGCLLAHTMGLGKTMQVISVLVTIAQCNQSSTPGKADLIPTHLRQNRTMILCPASLLDNWRDEILMWTPTEGLLGDICLLVGLRDQKINLLRHWAAEGGVAIISYESFRSLYKSKGLNDELQAQVQEWLLKTPTLVVADEAHKMKNADSAIAKLTKEFKTSSRIALTGSPLNNHLIEYHTMIDWIARNYLGSMVEFKSTYSEPINYGLYQDSTNYERRKAQRQLYKLKSILAPKINRADISAVIADMPQKTEFYITVTLTDAQSAAYRLIAEHLLSCYKSSGQPLANAKLWSWLSILSWLCNHPSCLIKKLQERGSNDSNLSSASASHANSPVTYAEIEDVQDNAPENIQVSNDSTIVSFLPEIESIFQEAMIAGGLTEDDPALSHRSLLTCQIIQEAASIGDKTLLFSHSIPTLNYLESMLQKMGLRYLRIDGSTQTSKRQEATKLFNEIHSGFSVFLISTRAGGLGLNLQGANRVIIYDFGFNPSWEEQAIGRAYRFGQQRPVHVYRFRTGGTFENAMHNTAVFKTQLFSRVVDYKNVTRHASKAVESYLFVPTDVPMEDFSESLGKDPDVLDKLVTNTTDGYVRDIVLTETFQIEDVDDELTPEEVKSAEEELVKEKLMKEDPAAYQQLLFAEAQRRTTEAQQASAATIAPPFPFVVPSLGLNSEWRHDPFQSTSKDDMDLEKM